MGKTKEAARNMGVREEGARGGGGVGRNTPVRNEGVDQNGTAAEEVTERPGRGQARERGKGLSPTLTGALFIKTTSAYNLYKNIYVLDTFLILLEYRNVCHSFICGVFIDTFYF